MSCFWIFVCHAFDIIGQHIARNSGAYGTAGVGFGLAVAKNIPALVPKSIQELWTWMRDSIQTALPITRASSPTQPVDPAKK